ncbi:hypothetical protein HA440_32100 [Klebsiella michiganensis]|nr:hypothetical protein [Klebsiella michiganensis]MBD0960767.1 hypothetical protein [Klebsiella michiganensis]
MFAGKKSAQIREILISESAWEEMTCLFAPSLVKESSIRVAKTANRTVYDVETIDYISNQINEAGREIKKIHDRAKTQHTQLEARAAQWKEKRFMVAKELSSK